MDILVGNLSVLACPKSQRLEFTTEFKLMVFSRIQNFICIDLMRFNSHCFVAQNLKVTVAIRVNDPNML